MSKERKRVVILTGGNICLSFAREYLEQYGPDIVIAVDKGMMAARALGLELDYAVGDYDSVDPEVLHEVQECFLRTGKPIIRTYQPEKDATDTEIAVSLALSLEPECIVLLGATGTRLDHAFANIQVLYQALSREIPAYMVDEHNRIFLADRSFTLKKKESFGAYLSLIPMTESVAGLTLKGMKYPLEEAEMVMGSSLGVSNEIVEEEAAVEFRDGILIVFETKD